MSRQSRGGAARRWGEGSVRAGVWRETPFSPPPRARRRPIGITRARRLLLCWMERAGGLAGEGSGTRPEGWSPGHSGRFSPSCGASPGPGSPTEAADEPVQKQSAQVPSSRATRTVSSGDQAGCAARLSRRKAWGCREGSPGRALSGDRSHSSAAQEPITDHVQASGPCEKSGRNLSNPSGTLKSLVFCFF